jgi:hypothetical protein
MSDMSLPKIEQQGFPNSLFLNMSEFYPNCKTPKRELPHETIDCSRLSIESLTPGTTPEGSEKKKDSNFKFCLSKDLLQRLEENSPFTNYSEKNGKFPDICLLDEDNIPEDEEIEEKNRSLSYFTSTTLPSKSSDCGYSSRKNCEAKYEHDDVTKMLNFEQGEISNFSNLQVFSYSGMNQGMFNNFGKNFGGAYTMNVNFNPIYFTSSGCISTNKYNQLPVQNLTKNLFNLNNSSLNQINDQTVNMYGKSGWVCCFCKNFNYESIHFYYLIS